MKERMLENNFFELFYNILFVHTNLNFINYVHNYKNFYLSLTRLIIILAI